MQQPLFLPNRIASRWNPSTPTASLPQFAEGEDGLDYVIKDDSSGRNVRAGEWICSQLALAINIPIPLCRIFDDGAGGMLFGSQIVHHSVNNNIPFFRRSFPGTQIVSQISRIYAFDLFIANVDRHLNNYLIRDQDGRPRVFAFDFSHALFHSWPSLPLPLDPSCKTIWVGRIIRGNWGFDLKAAEEVIMSLSKVPVSYVTYLMNSLPVGWLTSQESDGFMRWWRNGQKTRRLRFIKVGLRDA